MGLLLDAPSLVYRAFFAWPTDIKDPAGRSVNAVRGFLSMATTLLVDHDPHEMIVVLNEDWRPAFRVAAYDGYKSVRAVDPPELPWQFELLDEVLDAFGLTRVAAPGLEADDAIAILVEQLPAGERAAIVTGDRDLLALVRDPDVWLLFTVKGVTQLAVYDEAAVEAKYGVPPRLYPEFAMLRGDPSDHLPGVPGVGAKTAATLLRKFGSIDGIYDNLGKLRPAQRAAFREARDYLDSMKTVVGLVRDAPLERHDSVLDPERVEQLARDHNLGGSAGRLLERLQQRAADMTAG